MIDHRKPVLIAEGLKRLPFPKFPEVQLYPLPARYPFGDKLRHLIVAVFCFIVPRGKTVVTFLVLRLVEGNVGVLTDAFLDQFGGDIDLRLQIGKFPLQFVRCESRSKSSKPLSVATVKPNRFSLIASPFRRDRRSALSAALVLRPDKSCIRRRDGYR